MKGLVANICLFVGVALLINGVIFALGWGGPAERLEPSFAPPGWLIGTVWMFLFALLGVARWAVLGSGQRPGSPTAARDIALLTGFCALYPAYTLGLSSLEIGLIGNILTMGAAVWVAWRVRRHSLLAVGVLGILVAWVVFATVLVVRTMQLNSA